ncbi:MAG: phosphoglycerate kinase [Candidatus Staskawiczbacteria bacterium]|nr:phosphoglycerate kinase [Candidatus Staskawiczbacteria bacterium]
MKTLKDVSVINKRVLVRCDFNVPLDEKGNILDDYRIQKTLTTIKYLIENKARVILMSHLGEPGGKVVEDLKMDKVAEKLAEYLGFPIEKEDDCVGPDAENESKKLEPGKLLLLENLRFHKEETENDLEFAKKLSYLGDIFVNDAFGVCHRAHASVALVPTLLPSCAGLLLEKEIESLDKILKNPEKPMVAIVGGTKVSTKSKFIDNISKTADTVIVSGLIAKEVAEKNIKFSFPEKIIAPVGQLDALDINEESIKIFQDKILSAKTVLWNGPFGKFEDEKYAKGSLAIAKAIVKSGAFSVVGGGETVEFIAKNGMIDKFSHVSTGGGAMLSYLSGDPLPGITALN